MDLQALLARSTRPPVAPGRAEARVLAWLRAGGLAATAPPQEMNGVRVHVGDHFEAHVLGGRLLNLVLKPPGRGARPGWTLGGGAQAARVHRGLAIGPMLKALARAGIAWRVDPGLSGPDSVVLVTEGNATLEFVASRAALGLNRIHVSDGVSFD